MGVYDYKETIITHDLIVYKLIFAREFGLYELDAFDGGNDLKQMFVVKKFLILLEN